MNIRLNSKLITNLGNVFPQPMAEIIKATGIPPSTFYDIRKNVEDITIEQLLAIANGLHIPVRRLFSTGKADVVGFREDYVVEPYLQCSCNGKALEDYIRSHRGATWKAAGEAVDMTWSGLRESLKSDRRFPVSRLLAVCKRFGIDPFTVIIDPNPDPEPKKERGKSRRKSEIDALRSDVDALTATVADLKDKYEALLKAHEALLHRVQINIDTISGGSISNIGIAADT